MDTENYGELVSYWTISLRSDNKSGETIRSYLAGVRQFAAWCAEQGHDPDLTMRNAEGYTAAFLTAGCSSATATSRQLAVRQFSAWLAEREYTERDELAKLRAPRLDQQVVDGLTADQLRALIGSCKGRRFVDVRDTAIVRYLADTGSRADELCSLKVIDVQIAAGSAVIVRGKGGKGRRSGFGPRTQDALVRYVMARKKHPLACRPEFWLAERQRVLNYQALYATLRRRAESAGIEGFHPHQLRHTMAVRWLRSGGTVTGLMAQGGWTDVAMVRRYIEAASEELAIEESHRLWLDDI